MVTPWKLAFSLCKSTELDKEGVRKLYVLAHEELATTAVEALLAKLAIVGSNTVTDLETLGFLEVVRNECMVFIPSKKLTGPTAATTPTVS
jgi:hypothetical protein